MSYLVLARKYRPQTFEDVVKQEHVTQTLSNAIASNRVAHAILFSGPRGTGKTTIARILAKSMNCKQGPTAVPCNVCRSCTEITSGNAADVFEIDGASNNGVDHIRELRENIRYMPNHSPYKIYIIDEVHMLSTQAFNALLKTLEEPPEHIMFLFATTEAHKIPITILSRCQRHDLRRIDLDAVTRHMANLCRREEINISEESLGLIARESGGSMRDALSLLDHVMTCSQGNISHEQMVNILGVVDRKILFDISSAVIRGDVPAVLNYIQEIYDHGHNIKEFYSSLIEHFRNLLVVKMARNINGLIDVPSHEIGVMGEQVRHVSELFLTQILDVLFKEETTIKFSNQPRLALEMAFIRMFQIKPSLPIEKLIEKLDNLSKGAYEEAPGIPAGPQTVPTLREAKAYEPAAASPVMEAPQPEKQELVNKTLEKPQEKHPPVPALPKAAAPAPPDTEPEEPAQSIVFDKADSPDQVWEKLKTLISSQSSALGAYLNKCILKNLSNNNLEIEVGGNSFNYKQIYKKEALIKSVCGNFFGRQIDVTLTPGASPSNVKKQEDKDQENRKKNEAFNHPLTGAALEIFNGKVIEIRML